MAPTIAAIMAGIETRLATISGLRVNDVDPYNPTPPFAFVGMPDNIDYHATMGRGKAVLNFTITVGTSSVSDRSGQLALADYASFTGTKSIIGAIEGDRTLGGVVDDCVVTGFRKVDGFITLGQATYFGGIFSVMVAATGI